MLQDNLRNLPGRENSNKHGIRHLSVLKTKVRRRLSSAEQAQWVHLYPGG